MKKKRVIKSSNGNHSLKIVVSVPDIIPNGTGGIQLSRGSIIAAFSEKILRMAELEQAHYFLNLKQPHKKGDISIDTTGDGDESIIHLGGAGKSHLISNYRRSISVSIITKR
ncbi:MAG: hypothetical protein K1V84_01015 [Muribaculaceae bacterium]